MREPIVPQFDAEGFLRWEERQEGKFELHHGFAIAFAGATFDHERIARNLQRILERLYPAPCEVFGSDVKIRVSAANYYYCDAGVVCEPVAGYSMALERPRVVAEVLSRSTRAYDLVDKRAAYRAMPSLESYIIVHTDMRRVEVDVRSANGEWQTRTYDDDEAFFGARAVTLDEIYARSSIAGSE